MDVERTAKPWRARNVIKKRFIKFYSSTMNLFRNNRGSNDDDNPPTTHPIPPSAINDNASPSERYITIDDAVGEYALKVV
jgi:hypothetical protein